MKKVSILFFMFGLFLFNIAYAASVKEEYELQERCKKSVDAWFQKEWDGKGIHEDKDLITMVDYQNHYNKKLNKCFVLVTTTMDNKKSKNSTKHIVLFDINENKQYGDFFTTYKSLYLEGTGWVLDTRSSNKIICHDKGNWDELIKLYMEE
ncbi:MAG: hypothetical protein FJ134_09970 [Deltaproteobacteria bacterium]|nr:hypothetical protein [Deltaproteobacteria bacterium]